MIRKKSKQRKKKLTVCVFAVFIFMVNIGIAQRTIRGVVKEQGSDELLVGVNVVIKGTTAGTTTDIDGKYSIVVNDADSVLVFSFIGYMPKETVLGESTTVDVLLKMETVNLNTVVVTALGIEREKKALGYAVQEVGGDEINKVQDANLLNNLSGKVAGITVLQGNSGVGSSSRMVVRGEGSLSGDNQPLYVVDGVPVNNYTAPSVTNSSSSGTQEVDYGNGAGEINPNDIESITVLKGANAAALYGSRAANGVVVITTKSGKGKKGIGVSVNSTTTFENYLVVPKWQDQYGQGFQGEWLYEDGNGGGVYDSEDVSWGPQLDKGTSLTQFDGVSHGIVNGEYVEVRGGDVLARNAAREAGMDANIVPSPWVSNPDNVNDFFETGVNYTTTVAITGADENGNFRLSFTNLDANGIIPNNDLNRNTVSLKSGYRFSEKLSAQTSVSYVNSASSHRPGMGYGSENPMYVFAWFGRQVNTESLKEYWQKGYDGIRQYNYNSAWHDNPYLNSYENTNSFDKHRMFGNLSLRYAITDKFTLMGRTGTDFFYDNRVSKRAYSSQRFPLGMYREDDVFFKETNSDLLATYSNKASKDIAFEISAGGNVMEQVNTFTSNIANQLAVPGIYSLNNTATPIESYQFDTKKRINSLYAFGQFAFKEMLFIELTARNDWSSTLPKSSNSYFYPSISASALLTEFIDLPRAFSFWKLRAGYAEVGNDTDPYNVKSTYVAGTSYNSLPAFYEQTILPNVNLHPELMRSVEIGTDLRLWNGLVNVDLTYYNSTSDRQIISLPVSTASGYQSRIVNAGKIRNAGIETMLSLNIGAGKDFTWHPYFNFAKNASEVLEIYDNLETYVYAQTSVYNNSSAQVFAIAKVGDPVGNIYGTGFKKADDGKIIVNENGMPIPDNDLRVLGNYNPDFTMGIGNSFKYKGVSLNALFDIRQGGVVVSRMYSIATTAGTLDHTAEGRETGIVVPNSVINTGTEESPVYQENTVSISAQDYYKNYWKREHEESSTFDASFVKLREVSIGYTFPKSFLSKFKISDLTFSLVGRNLALWTSQNHFDPETVTYENDQLVPGVEEMSYPSTRSIGYNISFKF